MYKSYTKIFRIFGAMIIFLQISKDSALFTNSENKNFHCSSSSLALTARPHCKWLKADTRRCSQFRSAKRAGGDSPVRWTAPTWSTPCRESNPTLRTATGTPDGTLRQPWLLGLDGGRRSYGYGVVESKEERASRSGAHRDHKGVLGAGGDVLNRPGHGEVGHGGASAGLGEDDVARWRWTSRSNTTRLGRSRKTRRSY